MPFQYLSTLHRRSERPSPQWLQEARQRLKKEAEQAAQRTLEEANKKIRSEEALQLASEIARRKFPHEYGESSKSSKH